MYVFMKKRRKSSKHYHQILLLNKSSDRMSPVQNHNVLSFLNEWVQHKIIMYWVFLTLSTLGKFFSGRHIEIFCLLFPENRFWHFMQIVSIGIGDNLYEMSKPVSGKNKKNISICRLLKILRRVLIIKTNDKCSDAVIHWQFLDKTKL